MEREMRKQCPFFACYTSYRNKEERGMSHMKGEGGEIGPGGDISTKK